MTKLAKKLKTPKGFMIIIAMIMFAIMSYWSIATMKRNIQVITNTKNTNLYYRATAIADSMMEDLIYTVKKEHDSGYNLDLECNYGKYKDGDNDPRCADFLFGGLIKDEATDNVRVKLTIKGRSGDNEKFTSCGIEGFANGCYVTPFPGTGDASEKCKGYKPNFNDDNASADKKINGNGGFVDTTTTSCTDGIDCINQLDYACNWNKLQFGSNLLDRAVIPFYYDNGNGNTVSPFKDGGNFVLRVRTPCKPCEDRFSSTCNSSSDPTICRDNTIATINDRYELDDKSGDDAVTNDTVVQWQLTGQCGAEEDEEDKEECGLIQYKDLSDLSKSSAITESRINNGDRLDPLKNHVVLYAGVDKSKRGMDTNIYSESDLPEIFDKLKLWTKPILALFLGEKLKTDDPDEFVPYLEYQVLTDTPIANPKIQMDVFVSVDDIGARKTMYKYEQKQLVDFAIQN